MRRHLPRAIWILAVVGAASLALTSAAPKAVDPIAEHRRFRRSPVILVPGDGGNQLWARLNGTKNHWYCQRFTKPQEPLLVWVQLSNLVYPAVKCLAYNLMLTRQRDRQPWFKRMLHGPGESCDNVGVDSFVPGFGTVDTMLWVGDWQSKYTAYFSPLVDRLVAKRGYTKNVTIRGAPYDFRKAPNELGDYFDRVKTLVEDTYAGSGGVKVVLVAHSMGAKLMLHFLQHQPQNWKDKYVEHFLAAGGAFGGVTSSLLAVLSGYNLGIPLVKPAWFRPVQRSWPSTHYLLPGRDIFPPSHPLVTDSSGATYSTGNLSALFSRASYPKGSVDYESFQALTDIAEPPGVPTTCVFGSDVPTPSGFRWSNSSSSSSQGSSFPHDQPSGVDFESGDGTIAMTTGRICRRWAARQSAPVRVVRLPGAQHVALLSDARFLRLAADLAAPPNNF